MNEQPQQGKSRLKQVYCSGCECHRMMPVEPGASAPECLYCGETVSLKRSKRGRDLSQLERQKRKQEDETDEQDKPEKKASVSRMNCPSCGDSLKINRKAGTVTLICRSCGSQIDPEREKTLKEKAGLRDECPPRVPIELGMTGTYRGADLEVIGRIRYEAISAPWTWDEWCLHSEEKGYWWLTEYNRHFHIYQPAKSDPTPSPPNLNFKDNVRIAGMTLSVAERDSAKIKYLEGEFPWKAKQGEKIQYVDAVDPPYRMSAEWTPNEMNVYIGEYLQPEKVWSIFDLEGDPPEPKGVSGSQPMPKWFKPWLVGSSLVSAVIVLITLFLWFGPGGETVKSYNLNLNEIKKKTKNKQLHMTEPFKLNQAPSVVKLRYRADANNSWAWVRLVVIDEQDRALYSVAETLEYYHGTSGGESWSEGDRDEYQLIRFENKGPFRFGVQSETGTWRSRTPPDRLTVQVKQDVFAVRYLLITAILSLIIPGYLLLKWNSRRQKVWGD